MSLLFAGEVNDMDVIAVMLGKVREMRDGYLVANDGNTISRIDKYGAAHEILTELERVASAPAVSVGVRQQAERVFERLTYVPDLILPEQGTDTVDAIIAALAEVQPVAPDVREAAMRAEGITEEDIHETLYEHQRTRRPEEH